MGDLVLTLFFGALFSVMVAVIAHTRGRSALAWAFIGFFLSIFGLILVLVLPNLEAERAKYANLQRSNARLRERIKKDRQVADSRHDALSGRVNAHDRALGVETDQRDPALLSGSAPPLPGSSQNGTSLAALDWYYVSEGEAKGPVVLEDLRVLRREGRIGRDSLMWHEGMAEWTSLTEIDGLEKATDV